MHPSPIPVGPPLLCALSHFLTPLWAPAHAPGRSRLFISCPGLGSGRGGLAAPLTLWREAWPLSPGGESWLPPETLISNPRASAHVLLLFFWGP